MSEFCPRCGKAITPDDRYCPKCGIDQASFRVQQAPADEKPCHRHPKVMTALSCGRCGTPICTKCVLLGPAGPRCRECAKTNVGFRPAAMAHEFKRFFVGIFRYSPWLTIIVAFALVGALSRGCMMLNESRRTYEPRQEEPSRTPEPATLGSER